MKKRWSKGEPVNLSDLLKITPVANEIVQLSGELDMSTTDVMWIVSQIIDNQEIYYDDESLMEGADSADDEIGLEEDWDDLDRSVEQEMDLPIHFTLNQQQRSLSRDRF